MSDRHCRVLVIDDNPDDLEFCDRLLRQINHASYSLARAETARGAFSSLESELPDCVLLDYSMPDVDGLQVLQRIAALHPGVPVVMWSSRGETEIVQKALQYGAKQLLSKSGINSERLHAAIESAMEEKRLTLRNSADVADDETLVLIIDDNPDDAERCVRALNKVEDMSYRCLEADTGAAGLAAANARVPDCVLLDYSLPGHDGLEILKRLRSDRPFLPVIFMTGQGNETIAVNAIRSGAHDYVTKSSITPENLHSRVRSAIQHAKIEQQLYDRDRKLLEKTKALAESEGRFRLLIECVKDYAIFALDQKGNICSWSPAAQAIKGYAAEDVLGRHISILWQGEGTQSNHVEEILSVAETEGTYAGEAIHARKDGKKFLASIVVSAIRNDQGEFLGYVVVARDITEKREAEERSVQAQKMEALGQLTGGVAHDFNNLLTSIIGNLRLISMGLDEQSPLRKRCNSALLASERSADLTRQLLAFSRRQVLEEKVLNVKDTLSGIEDMLHRTLGETITLAIRFSGHIKSVKLDAAKFESAILNLVVNARDAMRDGGSLTIEVDNILVGAAQAEKYEVACGTYVVLAIGDTGAGIERENLKRIFEPFFTTKEVGRGTGLGLAQIYGFAKQSRGFVTVYSEVGIGTVFKLYFPACEPATVQAQAKSDDGMVKLPKSKVLLVEDDAAVLEVTSCMLEQYGLTVITAGDGPSALKQFEAHPDIDLLFTDVILPNGMNGKDIARECLKRRPALKVLFASGYTGGALSRTGALEESDIFLSKPFDEIALGKRLSQALRAA